MAQQDSGAQGRDRRRRERENEKKNESKHGLILSPIRYVITDFWTNVLSQQSLSPRPFPHPFRLVAASAYDECSTLVIYWLCSCTYSYTALEPPKGHFDPQMLTRRPFASPRQGGPSKSDKKPVNFCDFRRK